MPDITLCQDIDCPTKKECRRSIEHYDALGLSIPYRQSYFAESPRDGDICEEFWQIKDETNG